MASRAKKTKTKSRYRNKFKTEWSAELTSRVSYTDSCFHSLCNFVASINTLSYPYCINILVFFIVNMKSSTLKMFISKIMSQGQKRPQNSSDCSICNLDFKKFRGGPRTPLPMPLASLGSRYRPCNSYLLPHIQGGRSTALCLYLFGTSVVGPYNLHIVCLS